MKQKYLRAVMLAAILPIAGFTLAGCPKQEASSTDAPYGQPAADVNNSTPPPAAPDTAPPGPRMGGAGPGAARPGMGGPPPGPGMGGGPMSGSGPMMGGNPMAPLTPTPQLDKAIKDAETKGDKKSIAAAYASRGYSRMMDDNAGQRIKYREALKDFRTALKNDPANEKAKQNKATIEEIYTSMGRPVPE